MDPLAAVTTELFKKNRFVGHYTYVRPNEVVPHFFSRGSYYLSRRDKQLTGTVNSCLHRGYKLVTERTKLKPDQPITCKLHGWKYGHGGELLTQPGFDHDIKQNCLGSVQFAEVKGGLFFEADSVRSLTDLSKLLFEPVIADIDLHDYQFDQENVAFYQVNWRTIMEIYLSSYNLENQHQGMGQYLKGEPSGRGGREYSLQIHPINTQTYPAIPGIGWSKFYEEVRKVSWNKDWGAIFAAIFPGMMIEYFPHTIVINQLVPLSNKMTASYVQIFYDSLAREDYDFQNAFTEAYSEAAQETAYSQDILEDGRMGNHYDVLTLPTHTQLEAGIRTLNTWEEQNRPKWL